MWKQARNCSRESGLAVITADDLADAAQKALCRLPEAKTK